MRKITEKAKEAFDSGCYFSSNNTQVACAENGEVALFLHCSCIVHMIAWRDSTGLYFSMCGWATNTTRERLQAAGIRIAQHKGKQYFVGYWTENMTNKEFYNTPIDSSASYEVGNDMTEIRLI